MQWFNLSEIEKINLDQVCSVKKLNTYDMCEPMDTSLCMDSSYAQYMQARLEYEERYAYYLKYRKEETKYEIKMSNGDIHMSDTNPLQLKETECLEE